MRRLALPLALLLAACGDDATSTSFTTTTTGDGSTSTGAQPTTSGESSSSGASTSSGSDSATGSTSGGSTTATSDATTSSGTTQGANEGSSGGSSTSSDDTTSSTTTTTTTGTTSDDTTSETTGDQTTGDEVDPPPIPNGTCNEGQGPLTTFVEPMPQVSELHIVAMYQATGDAVTVTVTRALVPLTLVLSSYEPVAFTLVLAPGVQLEHVILNGYNKHTVQGQGAAMVTDISANFGDPSWVACGYFWPMNDGGCDTPENVASAELLTGLTLTTFAGCYEGVSFTLD